MMTLKVEHGHIEMISDGPMTIAELNKLVTAAEVTGIPANTYINSLSFQYGFGRDGNSVRISLGWRVNES